MKITVSGLHSQGKTRLIQAIKDLPIFSGYTILDSICRGLMRQGYQINENCEEETQLLIARLHIKRFNEGPNLLIERCPLDTVAYAKYLLNYQKISRKTFDECYNIHLEYTPRYDFVFYLKPELPLRQENFQGRSDNKQFFEESKKAFEYFVSEYSGQNLYILSGSVEDRVEQIKNALKNVTYRQQ